MNEKELKILDRAIAYTSSLARGVNPLDNRKVSPNDVVNQEKIHTYLEYVEQILKKYRYEQLNPVVVVKNSLPFGITREQLKNYTYSEEPLTASAFCAKLGDLTNNPAMSRPRPQDINAWLIQEGYLQEIEYLGKIAKTPTEKGKENGILAAAAVNQKNEAYIRLTFTPKAQQLLLKNIYEITDKNAAAKKAAAEQAQPSEPKE
jgi:hypothetical protein